MTNRTYDLFGVTGSNLVQAKDAIERALGIVLQEHDSSFRGGLYFRAGEVGRSWLIVQHNRELDEELAEEAFPAHPILVYVQQAPDPDNIKAALDRLSGVTHLRREIL